MFPIVRVKECVRFPDYSAPLPVDGSAPTTGRFQIFCGGKRVGYGDPDTGIWDGEDKTMTYIDTINGTVERSVGFPAEVSLEFDLADPKSTYVRCISINNNDSFGISVQEWDYK